MKRSYKALPGIHVDRLEETLWEPHTKDSFEAVFMNDSRKVFTWDSYKRCPYDGFATEVCTRCPHERLGAPLRWEEPIAEIKSHEDFKNRKVRVRRLKT